MMPEADPELICKTSNALANVSRVYLACLEQGELTERVEALEEALEAQQLRRVA